MVLAHNEIVKSPASVLLTGTTAQVPVAELLSPSVYMSIGVDHTSRLQEVAERLSLLWSEACGLVLALSAEDVNLLMRHVQIASQNHGLLVLHLQLFFQEVLEILVPRVDAVPQALEAHDS